MKDNNILEISCSSWRLFHRTVQKYGENEFYANMLSLQSKYTKCLCLVCENEKLPHFNYENKRDILM